MMNTGLKRTLIAGIVIAALGAGGAAIALGAGGTGGEDGDGRAITGPALERAKAAALEHTGGGSVTATEAGDEEGAYEVEVRRDDGSQVDVHLDGRFDVISGPADNEAE